MNTKNKGEASADHFLITEELSIVNLFPQNKWSNKFSIFKFWYVMLIKEQTTSLARQIDFVS
jgi:hypothetical protein